MKEGTKDRYKETECGENLMNSEGNYLKTTKG
jgi:hypothetical protein